MKREKIVLTKCASIDYPKTTPFRPSEVFPELIYKEVSTEKNNVFDAVRKAFFLLGLDLDNYGSSNWNPLGELISKGNTVLIKPNLVMDHSDNQELERNDTDCLITHPSVVAPIIDYVAKALDGSGKIVLGDAPMQECDFDALIENSGYKKMVDYYKQKGLNIDFVDFRELKAVKTNGIYHQEIAESKLGRYVNLGQCSEFAEFSEEKLNSLRISNYNPDELKKHHNLDKHEYLISKYLLDCDVVINVPKPKTHKKAGVTISLKNYVGINARKECLPHHSLLSKKEGGDEYLYPSFVHRCRSKLVDYKNKCDARHSFFKSKVVFFFIHCLSFILLITRQKYSFGSWYGNDTISRTVADLNRIVLYADKTGTVKTTPVRKQLIIADLIISGEKEGPISPSPKEVGYIAAGFNGVCFDEIISSLMGFNPQLVPTIVQCRSLDNPLHLKEADTVPYLISDDEDFNNCDLDHIKKTWNFVPASGWVGHIEKEMKG